MFECGDLGSCTGVARSSRNWGAEESSCRRYAHREYWCAVDGKHRDRIGIQLWRVSHFSKVIQNHLCASRLFRTSRHTAFPFWVSQIDEFLGIPTCLTCIKPNRFVDGFILTKSENGGIEDNDHEKENCGYRTGRLSETKLANDLPAPERSAQLNDVCLIGDVKSFNEFCFLARF